MPISYLLLIPDSSGANVLIHEGALPQVEIVEDFWWQDVTYVNVAVQAQLGLEVTTLSCVRIVGNEGVDGSRFYYSVEPQGEVVLSENRHWGRPLELVFDEAREVAQQWLALQNADNVPWYCPGWRTPALEWVKDILVSKGMHFIGKPEQLRSWERSSLWRLNAVEGPYYFKAIPPMFAHEPALTQALGIGNTDWFAPALSIDSQKGWLIMGDAGPRTLHGDTDAARWEAALRTYAEMQVAMVPELPKLLSLGLPDRRLNTLSEPVSSLLADTDALSSGPRGLTVEEIEKLWAQENELQSAIALLAQSGIPASLEHGDFAPGQIVVGNDGGYRFIDWSDSSAAFPFFSMLFFWAELKGELENHMEARMRLRDAYLEPWRAILPQKDLAVLFEAAMRVAPWHHALIYYKDVLPGMKARWEMERMLQYYLRLALREA